MKEDPAVICLELREMAAQAPDPAKFEHLTNLLAHRHQPVRTLAGRVLGKWMLPGSKGVLREWFERTLLVTEWHGELAEAVTALRSFITDDDAEWLCEAVTRARLRLNRSEARFNETLVTPLFSQCSPSALRSWAARQSKSVTPARRQVVQLVERIADEC